MQLNTSLLAQIQQIITDAQNKAIRSVDTTRVLMYWHIGRVIFEEEQAGQERAEYGAFLIKSLAATLEPQHGSSFTTRQLERYRQFYRTFPNTSALRSQFSWTHYRTVI
jgi:hypothetical protein